MGTAVLREKLQDFLRERFGREALLRAKAAPEFVPTGLGGIRIPRGTLSEIFGPTSSGRTSLLHAVLARSTETEILPLIDAGDMFIPSRRGKQECSCGICFDCDVRAPRMR